MPRIHPFRLTCLLVPRLLTLIFAALALILSSEAVVKAAPGDLDPTFDGDGKVTTDFFNAYNFGQDVIIQPDGKIIVAGYAQLPTQTPSLFAGGDFALARYMPDGSLDTSFGNNGRVTTDFFGGDFGLAVALQSDGKIVVAGYGQTQIFTTTDFQVARYNANGSPDLSFDADGKVTTSFSTDGDDEAFDVIIQQDGKIVIVGTTQNDLGESDYALARYNSDGSLDSTFGNGGRVITDSSEGDALYAVALQADGKIIGAGIASQRKSGGVLDFDFALLRYNIDGSLDSTFGLGGKVTTDFAGSIDQVLGVVLQPDQKILAAGISRESGSNNNNFALARYNSDGSLDTSFDTDGKVTTDFFGGTDSASGLVILPNGKIIACGRAIANSETYFALAQYNVNGSLDSDFGTGGKVTTDIFPGANDIARDIAIQSDGKIILAGTTENTSSQIVDFALARYIGNGEVMTQTLQLGQGSYSLAEGTGSLNVLVNRTGDPSLAVTVNYTTSDAAIYLQDCNVINNQATSRCDYVAVVGALHFAIGETSKTISIPVVDDTYAEGTENFFITLSNPTGGGATLGAIRSATISITDNGNDGAGQPNPINNATFFVRQHYIDFLSREPDPASSGWLTQLSGCGAGDQSCRLSVSQGIYSSPEFKDRGYFIYKFFSVGLGRKPSYDEFNVDRARVSGFQTDAELEQSKKDFIADFMSRSEFANAHNGLSNDAYVQKLFTTAGVTQITVGGVARTLSAEQQLLAAGTINRAQVLRDVAESAEASARFQTESTVVMHYFGYLRRDPDAAYQDWITTLTVTGDSRNVTEGFVNSAEYRARFGQ